MFNEEAKAATEVAKTAGKAIDLTRDLGKWLAGICGPMIEDGIGIVHDRIRYFRLAQAFELRQRFDAEMHRRGISEPKPVPPQLALPILEAATLEEKPELMDLWARLLASAADPSLAGGVRKAFIRIIEDLEPIDAEIFRVTYEQKPLVAPDIPNLTRTYELSNRRAAAAVRNLERLGILSYAPSRCEVTSLGLELGAALGLTCGPDETYLPENYPYGAR